MPAIIETKSTELRVRGVGGENGGMVSLRVQRYVICHPTENTGTCKRFIMLSVDWPEFTFKYISRSGLTISHLIPQ
jgi:hypothetical protein